MSDQVPGRSMVYTGEHPWCTQLQILNLPGLELNPLNFHLFFDFPPAKRVLSTRSSKSPKIYHIKSYLFFKRVRICKFSPAARTAWNPPSLDMQPSPHIHAPHEPTDPLVVAFSTAVELLLVYCVLGKYLISYLEVAYIFVFIFRPCKWIQTTHLKTICNLL